MDEKREARARERDAGITKRETKGSGEKGVLPGKVSAKGAAHGEKEPEGQGAKATKPDESQKGVKGAKPTV